MDFLRGAQLMGVQQPCWKPIRSHPTPSSTGVNVEERKKTKTDVFVMVILYAVQEIASSVQCLYKIKEKCLKKSSLPILQ